MLFFPHLKWLQSGIDPALIKVKIGGIMARKTYKAKTLFSGYLIGLGAMDQYVAAPEHSFNGKISYNGVTKNFGKQNPAATRSFADRFGRGSYKLLYFKWTKDLQQSMF